VKPVAHAGDDEWHKAEWRWVVVGPWVVTDAAVYKVVGIASALATELPYRPILAVF